MRLKLFLIHIVFSIALLGILVLNFPFSFVSSSQGQIDETNTQYIGVNMKGLYTSIPQQRESSSSFPVNYYEDSFRLISEAGMNHVRYLIYWESFVKNPSPFMKELKAVASAADKYNIKVIYDNHQFHTSSWLNPQRGTGFPVFLFENSPDLFPYKSGGGAKYESAKLWWTNWWDRQIKDVNGTDGWILMSNYLKQIVGAVDKHESTLGYEILSEPQVHNDTQWQKVGAFNSFMVDEMRKVTQKTLAYSQQIPASINDKTIGVTSENMAKMVPTDKGNVIFKVSLYGPPIPDTYQGKRFDIFVKAGQLANVPVYVGEWNNVVREQNTNEEGNVVWQINSTNSDISQTVADRFIGYMNDKNVWGWAYWLWNFKPQDTPNFNLINVTTAIAGEGSIQPIKYYDILKTAIYNNNIDSIDNDFIIKP